jgi:hypothetical protein
MGGLQDNGSWTGPAAAREPSGIANDDWRMISFGDGFYILNSPETRKSTFPNRKVEHSAH